MDNYVFGYGSLVDVDALAGFLGRPVPADEWTRCRLRGYRRAWNVAMDNSLDVPGYKHYVDAETGLRPAGFVTFLNIRPAARQAVNGIVFRVRKHEIPQIDARERNYDRIDVSGKLDPEVPGRVWTYRGKADAQRRYVWAARLRSAVISQDYFDAVQAAFLRLGDDFLADYRATSDPPRVPLCRLRRVPPS